MAEAIFDQDFSGRVLPFDARAAASYAELLALRRRSGRPIATQDLIVAAVAHAHRATIVTRDAGGFEGCGLTVFHHGPSRRQQFRQHRPSWTAVAI